MHRLNKGLRSPINKLVYCLLLLVGIKIKSSFPIQLMLTIAFHSVRLLSGSKIIFCLVAQDTSRGLFFIKLVSDILVQFTWWCLYIRRKKIYNFVKSLTVFGDHKINSRTIIFTITASIFLCPLFAQIIQDLVKYIIFHDFETRSCDIVPSYIPYGWLIVFAISTLSAYSVYFLFFVAAALYCICCILIVERWKTPEIEHSWIKCQQQIEAVKTLEHLMSFPILIIFCKITIDVFNTVLLVTRSTKHGDYDLIFIIACFQLSVWFICIIFSVDHLRGNCMGNVDMAVHHRKHTAIRGRELDFLDYMEMDKSSRLTGWNMFDIQRHLLMTATATLITYSVILMQLNEK